jgi:pseudaminic acid synthase
MKDIKIGDYIIGKDHKPFIIAEMSGNHNQSLDRALQLVDAAARAGAHAVKLQTYTADTLTMKGAYTIDDKDSLWYGKELYELYAQAYTPWEWHQPLFNRAKENGILAFSSPFDETAVDFLETLNVPVYKIASFENTHHPLLKKVASTGKPVIVSTGVSTADDINESVSILRTSGCNEIILLKCTSTYPSTPENTNLMTISDMINKYNIITGISDHTMGIGVSVAAVALGARVIEKHFTLRRSDGGVDSSFSLEPEELKSLVEESERAFLALGKVFYGIQEAEMKSIQFKRSIFVSSDIRKGEIFSESNLKIIRPAMGLAPKYWNQVIGRKALKDLKKGEPLKREYVDLG